MGFNGKLFSPRRKEVSSVSPSRHPFSAFSQPLPTFFLPVPPPLFHVSLTHTTSAHSADFVQREAKWELAKISRGFFVGAKTHTHGAQARPRDSGRVEEEAWKRKLLQEESPRTPSDLVLLPQGSRNRKIPHLKWKEEHCARLQSHSSSPRSLHGRNARESSFPSVLLAVQSVISRFMSALALPLPLFFFFPLLACTQRRGRGKEKGGRWKMSEEPAKKGGGGLGRRGGGTVEGAFSFFIKCVSPASVGNLDYLLEIDPFGSFCHSRNCSTSSTVFRPMGSLFTVAAKKKVLTNQIS